jgi:protein tyrosine/serine phosphatase
MGADKNKKNGRKLLAVVAIACLVGGGVWFWKNVAQDRLIPRRWAAVEERSIYRSGQLSAALVKRTLRSHGIKVIVALNNETPTDKNQQAERKAADELGIELLRFPLSGNGTGEVHLYADAIAAIAQARRQGKPVLVHCSAGVMRAGGVIACYQLLVEGKSPSEALKELMQHGWKLHDRTLLAYINENLAEIATTLRDKGIIETVPDPLPRLPCPEPSSHAKLGS